MLGERWVGSRKLFGYRTHRAPDGGIPNLEALELWVDARTGTPDHVDIAIAEPGKPHYTMHIKDIRVDSEIDRSVFDMTPPADYTSMTAALATRHAGQPDTDLETFRAEIEQSGEQTAVVVPMRGSYLQARAAVMAVESHLRVIGVTPAGPPFGRFRIRTALGRRLPRAVRDPCRGAIRPGDSACRTDCLARGQRAVGPGLRQPVGEPVQVGRREWLRPCRAAN